jgi:hypothetical protein
MNTGPDADDVRALREIVTDLARLPDANRYLAGLMSGLAVRYDLGDPDPFVGSRMIDLSLATVDGVTSVSTLLRTGRGLLLDLAAPLVAQEPVAEGVDRVVARVVDSTVGTALGEIRPVTRVLVRPDGYVAWAGAEPGDEPREAVQRWFGAGSGRPLAALT